MALQAKTLSACGPDELWRGLLELALTEYQQVRELVAQAEKRLDELGKKKAEVILLQTAPGVGPRTAETVVAYLHDATRFQTGKQVSAYSGLVPRQHQSASWTDGGGSASVVQRCCGRCWSNAPGAWCVTVPGRAASTSG
jgi:transposase